MPPEDRKSLIWAVVAIGLVVAVCGSSDVDGSLLRRLEVVAIVVTAAVVWWYTAETQRLREATEAQ